MLPLFDMMLRAQNGEGIDAIAKQFNMAQQQVTQAMAALMPAFSSGFKRTTASPYDLSSLTSAMFSGAYAKYFEDMTRAFTPQGISDGNAVLEKLFGSKEVSRAIAQQAEQFTGIGQDIFKKMMPLMADTLMGGLFKQMTGQLPAANEAFMASPVMQMSRQWLETMGLNPKSRQQEAADLFDNPFTQAIRSMWGMENPAQPQRSSGGSHDDNPFARAFQEIMAGTFQTSATKGGDDKSKAGPDIYRDMLNHMFDSGLEVQRSYQKNMEAILDTLRGGDKPASAGAGPET